MEESQPIYEKEISLRDYVLKGRSYFKDVIRYWYVPALFAVVVAGYQAYKYFTYTPVYNARVTFTIDEEESGSASGLSGMLSQFGLGNVRPARYNFDKILQLSKSRRVVQQTLFAKIVLDGKEDFLVNHLMRIYEINASNPAKDSGKEAFYFKHDSLPVFDRNENEVLLSIYNFIIGPPAKPQKALLTADYDEDSNIMTLSASTEDEILSHELANRMFESLSNYYINRAIEKAQKTYKIVTTKRDSVLAELRSAEYQLAHFKDSNLGLLMKVDRVSELRLQRDVAALTAMYVEVVKNAEVADYNLRSKTPFIQVIDAPLLPIAPTELSLLRKLVLGLILGGLVGAAIVVSKRIYSEMMAEKA